MRRARARAALLAALAALALGAWLLLREGGGAGQRAGARPAGEPDGAAARQAAELAPPPAGERLAGASGAHERTALAEEAAAPTGAGLIELRDAGGVPLAAAPWVVFRGDEVIAGGTTAEDGLARFARRAGAGELVVLRPSCLLQRFALDLALERQTVALAAGVDLAGRVEVDGRAPAAPITLTLRGDQALVLPLAVHAAFGPDFLATNEALTRTGAGGAFRFGGLPAGWSGILRWRGELFPVHEPPGERVVGRRSLPVTAPAEGLLVELTTGSQLTGTVVDPLTGEGFLASVRYEFIGQIQIPESEPGTTADDGTFSYTFRGALPEHVELRVSRPDGSGARRVSFAVPPGVRSHDLGLIEVLPTRTIAFAVQDEEGGAIAGARVQALPEDGTSARSDGEGRGALSVSSEARSLRVAASTFEPADVALPPDEGPVLVVLRRGTVLEVRVALGHGIRLEAAEPPFERLGAPSWRPEVAGGWMTTANPRPPGSVVITGEPSGVYPLTGVRAGVALDLRAVDRTNAVVAETAVPPLEPGEHRVVELAPAFGPGALAGRVVNAAGEPVAGAMVFAGTTGSVRSNPSHTDEEGRFRIEGLFAPSVRLVVEAQGYATLAIADQPVTDEPLELVLEPARLVRVTVVGPGAEPIPQAWVRALSGASELCSTSNPAAPGVYELTGIPAAGCTLEVWSGDRRFAQPLPAGATEARIVVPAWRACRVRVEGWAEEPLGTRSFVVLRTLGDEPRGTLRQSRTRPGEDEVRFGVVFPGRYEAFVARTSDFSFEEERLSAPVEVDVPPGALGVPLAVDLVLDAPR